MKKSEVCKVLPQTGKFTIVKNSGMGYLETCKINLIQWHFEPWAQYDDAMRIIFKKKGARHVSSLPLYNVPGLGIGFVILKSWVDVKTINYELISKNSDVEMNSLHFKKIDDIASNFKNDIAFLPPQYFDSEVKTPETMHYFDTEFQAAMIADIFTEHLNNEDKARNVVIDIFNNIGATFKSFELQNALIQEFGEGLRIKFCRACYMRICN